MIKLGPKMTLFAYACILALAAFALDWMEYKYLTRVLPTDVYIIALVTTFTVLGIWAGHQLSRKPTLPEFAVNEKAVKPLGMTRRELTVLELLADGKSNKQIARDLGISPNTVKTHIANLYAKLKTNGRMQAVMTARELGVLR